MKTALFLPALLLLLLLAPPLHADEATETPAAKLIAAHADSIVSVKFVLKMRVSFGGNSQDEENARETRGVLLDDSGLVMLPSGPLEGGMGRRAARMMRGAGGLHVDATPSDLKVLFGNDAKEYPAQLVAKDSDLGLAFVTISDLGERKVSPLPFEKGTAPVIGQTLLGITRMGRGFDCAPLVAPLVVEAHVDRPRPMWAVGGDFNSVGMPVFTEGGALAGVLSLQQGSEGVESDGGGGLGALLGGLMGGSRNSGLFLLPVEQIAKVITRAKAQASKSAEEDSSTEEPAKEEPNEEKPKDGKDGDSEDGDDEGGDDEGSGDR